MVTHCAEPETTIETIESPLFECRAIARDELRASSRDRAPARLGVSRERRVGSNSTKFARIWNNHLDLIWTL